MQIVPRGMQIVPTEQVKSFQNKDRIIHKASNINKKCSPYHFYTKGGENNAC
jgi:hypothetical protein